MTGVSAGFVSFLRHQADLVAHLVAKNEREGNFLNGKDVADLWKIANQEFEKAAANHFMEYRDQKYARVSVRVVTPLCVDCRHVHCAPQPDGSTPCSEFDCDCQGDRP